MKLFFWVVLVLVCGWWGMSVLEGGGYLWGGFVLFW